MLQATETKGSILYFPGSPVDASMSISAFFLFTRDKNLFSYLHYAYAPLISERKYPASCTSE